MRAEFAEFRGHCATLARHRQISVGVALDLTSLASWPDGVQDRAGFKELVSAAYQLWRETWKIDVRFLMSQRQNGPAQDFDRLVDKLRTSQQHADTGTPDAESAQWARTVCGGHDPELPDDWLACGTALMTAFNAAISALCQIVAQHQSPGFRTAWQAKVDVSEEAVVVRVAADLGIQLNAGLQGYHVSQVKRRWAGYRMKRGEVSADVLAAFAEQSLISRVETLPCSYLEVLGELGVVGTREAVRALHLAHAVAEITQAVGESYMKQLKEVWALLRN